MAFVRKFIFLIFFSIAATHSYAAAPDILLDGKLTGKDHQSYIEIPFQVPEGLTQFSLELSYKTKGGRATIDLGLYDPYGLRGWSGSNKSRITIGESFSTPSYRPGPVIAGEWRVVLGAPNIQSGAKADYEIRIWFGPTSNSANLLYEEKPAGDPGWRRGDLHSHTGHSDGSCPNDSGVRKPCPVHKTIDAALANGLDFLVISDHNTVAHYNSMMEAALFRDKITLIPGIEVTTFFGHANLIGAPKSINFRLTDRKGFDRLLDEAQKSGGMLSVNHPIPPAAKQCLGCGFTDLGDKWDQVPSIEVINGAWLRADPTGKTSLPVIAYWEKLLNDGRHITAVGGSDNHDPTLAQSDQSPVGVPATVVWSESAAPSDILAGIRSGRVYIDLTRDGVIEFDFSVRANGAAAKMGEVLSISEGEAVSFNATVTAPEGAVVQFVTADGEIGRSIHKADGDTATQRQTHSLEFTPGGNVNWVRSNIYDRDNNLIAVGNPVYIEIRKRP